MDTAAFVANDFRLSASVEQQVADVLGRHLDLRGERAAVPQAEKSGLTIVFDPLYLDLIAWTTRVIVYVLDLTPVTFPHWHDARVCRAYSTSLQLIYRPNTKVVAISESTRRDLWANYGIAPSGVSVVPLYDRFDTDRERTRRSVDRKLLFIGSLEERKNVRGLISAFEVSGLAERGYALHVVGGSGTGAAETRRHAAAVPGVFLLGSISDDELEVEYATCAALVYPSFWEGFGLPALEALSRRIPCVLSKTGALPEVGGGAAIYVDPCSVSSIADGLRKVTDDAWMQAHAAEFDREREVRLARFTRENYARVLDEVVDAELARIDLSPSRQAARVDEPISISVEANPINRRERWKRSAIEAVLRLRIVDTTVGSTPVDSFSVDYLYGIQQEKRLNLARAVASLRVKPLSSWPRIAGSILLRYAVLVITNAYVSSHINEMALLHFASVRGERDRE